MNENVSALKLSLDTLKNNIDALKIESVPFNSRGDYYYPAFAVDDLWNILSDLSEDIDNLDTLEPSESEIVCINNVISMLNAIQPASLEHIKNQSASVSSPAILSLISTLLVASFYIGRFFSIDRLKDRNLLPKNIIRRLNSYKENLVKIESSTTDIESKINVINEAYEAAEYLPTSLISLREANAEVVRLKDSSKEMSDDIASCKSDSEKLHLKSKEYEEEIKVLLSNAKNEAKDYLDGLAEEARAYIDKCEEAFRTTTSKGLAGAFEDKARKLNESIRLWVIGLAVALILGSVVGYFRLEALGAYLADANFSLFKITIQIVMSVMSIGAPLWFAWLATKQIGQRFRLAEDYEFKASVSKAYEGYRREAVDLDGDFASRLFGNALTRLEEAPLRFVEEQSHSSPIMEMLNSDAFKKFVNESGTSIDSVLRKSGLRRDAKKGEGKKEKLAEEKKVDERKLAEDSMEE